MTKDFCFLPTKKGAARNRLKNVCQDVLDELLNFFVHRTDFGIIFIMNQVLTSKQYLKVSIANNNFTSSNYYF